MRMSSSSHLDRVFETTEVHHLLKGNAMYVVVRSYSGQGASELFDLLGEREEDVKELILSNCKKALC
jgi:hypothetical protein